MSGHALDPQALGDHLDRLYRAAWAMCGSREDAEDLVQETYVRVLARPRFLRGDDDLGYLLRVLRNTHVSRLRAAGRRPVGVPFAEEAPEPEDGRTAWRPDAALDVGLVFTLIADLPEAFRDALVAVDVCGLSYAEAGRALGVREATITTRLHRARRQLAAGLREGELPAHARASRKAPAPSGVLQSKHA
jgi:RNA polymerase sigma-70 factor (ECF subfamily)